MGPLPHADSVSELEAAVRDAGGVAEVRIAGEDPLPLDDRVVEGRPGPAGDDRLELRAQPMPQAVGPERVRRCKVRLDGVGVPPVDELGRLVEESVTILW